jgi:hypothetical protein
MIWNVDFKFSEARTNFESSVPNDQAVLEDILFLCLTYKKLEFPLATQ